MATKKELALQIRAKIREELKEKLKEIYPFINIELTQIFKHLNYYKLQNLFVKVDKLTKHIKNIQENFEKNIYKKLETFNFKI